MESSKIPSVTTLGIRRGFYFPTHLKSPAFQFYATDYLGSQRVQMLTLEEEGAYIRLLCFCWQHGSIPASPKEMARLVGKGASTTLCTTLQPMFTKHPTEPGRLVHERLEEERSKQADWKERSIKGGQSSAARRVGDSDWGKKMAQLRRTSNEPATNQTVRKTDEPATSSPTPSPSPKEERRSTSPLLSLVFEEWNKTTVLKRCLLLSDKRRRSLQSRLVDEFFANNWKFAMQRIQASNFCKGLNERGWKASLDWFIRPDSVVKIMEGEYDNTQGFSKSTPKTILEKELDRI